MVLERERVVHSFSWQEANQLTQDFEQLHASHAIPMFYEDELIGAINLLPKAVSGSELTTPELKSLLDFAREAAQAFRNAAAFEALQRENRALAKAEGELMYSVQHSAISQLAVGMAHEIHNPLTIISGKAQILLLKKDKINYDAQVEEVLKTIVKQTKRAADITRKLLMFSDSEKSIKEWIDFEAVLTDTIALLSYQVSLDQIQVIKRFIHPIPKWYGNVTELREAFLNLFLNAVQAIGTKGTIEIGACYQRANEAIEVRISDSGPGISEENLARVFQPFFTTRDGAMGLGLFVTQQVVDAYGGTIRVEPQQGKGAAFVLTFPSQTMPAAKQVRAGAERGTVDISTRYGKASETIV